MIGPVKITKQPDYGTIEYDSRSNGPRALATVSVPPSTIHSQPTVADGRYLCLIYYFCSLGLRKKTQYCLGTPFQPFTGHH